MDHMVHHPSLFVYHRQRYADLLSDKQNTAPVSLDFERQQESNTAARLEGKQRGFRSVALSNCHSAQMFSLCPIPGADL